ncbi:hypothetical protein [Paracraurococcus ruber]|uniref:Uncharacterized protein n=1 Tax=Paracraurococcus ruber TaxID=77675 RepID=A0ABS1CTH9_9PROT|nr:hypothetical protein [Paracraurococcus ruber]MBK1657501.1 hypothetical protein [Paracraurococcus ruber]TDG30774.1 hypothetical protein E2C05_13165 [Paracraurococcus ruber]
MPYAIGDGRHGLHPLARKAAVEALVREQVLPRLRQRHGLPAIPPPRDPWGAAVAPLVAALPRMDLLEAARALRLLNPGGARFEALCHDLLLPAAAALRRAREARHLEETDYAMALWRLRMLLTGLEDAGRAPPGQPASALLVAGASHTPSFEESVVLRLFQRAGWQVHCCGRLAEEAPSEAARRDRFDLAWFSVDEATDLGRLCGTVAEVRRASCNRGLRVLSGWQRDRPPPPAALLGADAVSRDASVVVVLAQRVLSLH